MSTDLYVGCFNVPGFPQSLGNLDWVQCYEVALANKAQFFGTTAWNDWQGWHYYCILLSQLYTDTGTPFAPAVGQTCYDIGAGGLNSGYGGFMATFSRDSGAIAYAVYASKNGTDTWAKAPLGQSKVAIVHGE